MLNEHPQFSRAAWLEALPRDRTKEEEEEELRKIRAAAEEANAKAKAKADLMKKKETRLGSTRSQTRAASSLRGTSLPEDIDGRMPEDLDFVDIVPGAVHVGAEQIKNAASRIWAAPTVPQLPQVLP